MQDESHATTPALPAIRVRVARTLLQGALFWTAAVAVAVSLAVRHEAGEFLDKNLQLSAEVIAANAQHAHSATQADLLRRIADLPAFAQPQAEFAWQLVSYPADAAARVLMTSSAFAPSEPLFATPQEGFQDLPDWRIYGVSLNQKIQTGQTLHVLYAAQALQERQETQWEATLIAVLASVVMAVIAFLYLNHQLQNELEPLENLAERLQQHQVLTEGLAMSQAERLELLPVYQALNAMTSKLAQRLANERAFSAHAAHALRTPLAGIDAQLAVALRESPEHLQARLQTIRLACGRLQRVVNTLLTLFRSGTQIQRHELELESWALQLPWQKMGQLQLNVDKTGSTVLHADPDLLSVAVLNLLDNAYQSGAQQITLSSPRSGVLRLADDGPGVSPEQRRHILASLEHFFQLNNINPSDSSSPQPSAGLGLLLADMVARAHGGRLILPETQGGFIVELEFASSPSI